MTSIFKPRRNVELPQDVGTTPTTASSNVSPAVSANTSASAVVATKNKFYCVSKLPGIPSSFEQSHSFINAYSDSESNYSLVISNDSIYVWPYRSADTTPFSIHFPLDKSRFQLPMAILTRPSSGTGQDPGLVILDSVSGLVKFYESVQHAPTLGLINDKSLELTVNLHRGEYITMAENVEPAGIVVATSLQRCIVISLRDFKSKPHLSTLEILNPSSGILAKFFKHTESEIVAIRSGEIKDHGTVQQILILDSEGTFYSVCYNLLSANAAPYVDKKNSFKQNLYTDVTLTGPSTSAKYLDVWPLKESNYYLVLCRIDGKLLLATFGADHSGVLFYGSHHLKSAEEAEKSEALKNGKNVSIPKLFLPKPGKTAFVISGTSIIMTDINNMYVESRQSFSYHRPRWEDIVQLQPTTAIIGYGYEDQSNITNPAIILITKEFGVLRCERFAKETTAEEISDPVVLVKSHIEQAVFYSESSEIDFSLSHYQSFDEETIKLAVNKIVDEVINSTSPYLPATLPSTTDLLELKVKLLKVLTLYCDKNFPTLNLIPHIEAKLEKASSLLNLSKYLNANPSYKEEFEKATKDNRNDGNTQLTLTQNIDDAGFILAKFFKVLFKDNYSLAAVIVATLYNGVYSAHQSNEGNNAITSVSTSSWLYEKSSLLQDTEQYFIHEFADGKSQERQNACYIVQMLYHFTTSRVIYLKDTGDLEKTETVQNWFNLRKPHWMSVLLKLDLNEEATQIAEQYHDFEALARILDSAREFKLALVEQLPYARYFNQYGYPFAASVYLHYIKEDKIQDLLLQFTNYKSFLYRFFDENPKQTASISWVRYLLDNEYARASNALDTAIDSPNDQTIDNQLTQLSVLKLLTVSAIAAGSAETVNSNLSTINKEILKLQTQVFLRDAIANNGSIEAISETYFMNHYVSASVDKEAARLVVGGTNFELFVKNKPLAIPTIIDLLTIILPQLLNNLGYLYALKITKTVNDEKLNEYLVLVTLLRLLTIAVDSKKITHQKGKNLEEAFKRQVQESILYKTLESHPDTIPYLDKLLNNLLLAKEYNDQYSSKTLNDELLEELKRLLKNKGFKQWVEVTKEQAKITIMEFAH